MFRCGWHRVLSKGRVYKETRHTGLWPLKHWGHWSWVFPRVLSFSFFRAILLLTSLGEGQEVRTQFSLSAFRGWIRQDASGLFSSQLNKEVSPGTPVITASAQRQRPHFSVHFLLHRLDFSTPGLRRMRETQDPVGVWRPWGVTSPRCDAAYGSIKGPAPFVHSDPFVLWSHEIPQMRWQNFFYFWHLKTRNTPLACCLDCIRCWMKYTWRQKEDKSYTERRHSCPPMTQCAWSEVGSGQLNERNEEHMPYK